MKTVAVPNPRHTTETTPGEMRITIPAKPKVFIVVFMLIWLCFWTLGEFSVGRIVLSGESLRQTNSFTVLWLCFWTLAGGYVIIGILWQFAGEEIIQIAEGSIEIRYALFGIGFSKRYALDQAHQLRVSLNPPASFWNSRRGQSPFGEPGIIAFDYGASTIRVGRSLDEAEANQIVGKLRARFPNPTH